MFEVFDKSVRFAISKYTIRPRAKCGVFALEKQMYVCALLLPGHVGVGRKLLQKQCTCGNQGLSSHSEETKR